MALDGLAAQAETYGIGAQARRIAVDRRGLEGEARRAQLHEKINPF
jgi:hypothetical protein